MMHCDFYFELAGVLVAMSIRAHKCNSATGLGTIRVGTSGHSPDMHLQE